MGFNTLPFVFVFLPLFLAAFYLVPARWRAGLLCLGSLVFYVIGVWQRPWCLAPLLGLAVLVYLLGLRMRPRESRGLLVLGLAALFGCLFFFKYAGLLGLGVTLPLAISFYSFQLAAYLIDVYRGRVPAERKPLLFFTGVLLFPKLLSGPLMDPLSLHEQLSDPPRPGLEDFDSGLRDFILGLSMKVLLANQIGGLWRQVGNIGYESVSTPLAWMGIAAYSLQLYLDFCGYSWMALDLGPLLRSKQYSHIFVMLGLNEAGYPLGNLFDAYQSDLEQLRQLQPDATIYILKVYGVTADVAAGNPSFAHSRLTAVNQGFAELADGDRIRCLDSDTLFCGDDGFMLPEYTGDGVHPYGKFAYLFSQWLCEQITQGK